MGPVGGTSQGQDGLAIPEIAGGNEGVAVLRGRGDGALAVAAVVVAGGEGQEQGQRGDGAAPSRRAAQFAYNSSSVAPTVVLHTIANVRPSGDTSHTGSYPVKVYTPLNNGTGGDTFASAPSVTRATITV